MKSEVNRTNVDNQNKMLDLIMEHKYALRPATRHILTSVAKCIDVDGGIFENIL
jgi:hypothetical protein